MKILLLGKDGQVGRELQRSLSPLGDVLACGRHDADIENLDALRTLVSREAPQWIINAAAYTAVDRAENEPMLARRINAEAVALLAEESRRLGATFVHYSTDHVFDGEKTAPYVEDDLTNPPNLYGMTKRDGEQAIREAGCRHLIIRTSWIYAAHGNNFAMTMLHLAAERNELKVVADQTGVPTPADLVADVTALCLYRMSLDRKFAARASGTYHLATAGETSWYGYAKYVVGEALRRGAKLQLIADDIQPITTAEYPLPAKRPRHSRLDTAKLRKTFGLTMPPWQQSVSRVIETLLRIENP